MTAPVCLSPGDSAIACTRRPPFDARLRARAAHLVVWIKTCTDYYRASAMYEELSKLSDVELRRRGLGRATLGWDIAQACDRAGN